MPNPKKRHPHDASNGIGQAEDNSVHSFEAGEREVDERIVARRLDMLRGRQVDLDGLMDSHDDLVREAFQLDKFVTLLSYDPKIAKQDNSRVFLEYKAPHDLIAKSAAASSSGQNLRKTRRAITESRESLAATISAGASTPPTTPSSTTKAKGKARAALGVDFTPPGTTGKTKTGAKEGLITPMSSSASRGKGKAKVPFDAPPSDSTAVIMPPPALTSKRGHYPRRVKESIASKPPDTSGPSTLSIIGGSRTHTRKSLGVSSSRNGPKDSRHRDLKQDSGDDEPKPLEPPEPPKTIIKRIRLFQRPPPAVYTHPSQLPAHPEHDGSIPGFLNSYSSLENGIDVSYEELELMSSAEAKTRARIRELRREGRLMLDIPELPDGSNGIPSLAVTEERGMEELAREEDHYDHLVSTAAHKGRVVANEYAIKKGSAKKVAKLVMAWHGNKEGTEEKQRKAEAARMKTLARFTVKEVERQWRKAVMAVREQNRAVLEAEEARLGRKHLDAILDQSGVILEAQHTDLSRARSRSSSARDWSGTDGSEDDADPIDADEAMYVEASDEELEEDPGDGEDGGADVALLLGKHVRRSFESRDPSSESDTESIAVGDEMATSRLDSSPDTPASTSGNSIDTPLFNKLISASISVTPSEVTVDDRPITGAKTIPSTLSAADASVESVHEDTASGDEVERQRSEIISTDGSQKSVGRVDETSDPVFWASAPSQKGYRRSSSSRSHDRMSVSPSLPSSLLLPVSSPSPQSEPSNLPNASPGPAPETFPMSPLNTEVDPRTELNGRRSIAVRLSNGVVIYRDSDASSLLKEALDVAPTSDASKSLNGLLPDSSPVIANETSGATASEADKSSEELLPEAEVAETSQSNGTGQHDADSSTTLDVGHFKRFSPKESPPAVMQDVKPAMESTPVASSPDANGEEEVADDELQIAPHLVDFAATPVEWDTSSKVNAPFLLRGTLRPYQQSGLEWLASLHTNSLNGILADEMGLGKTIQTISLLAHLACDRGIWGPHLIVVPTSVLLNWEMEFKKFLPGFKILPYHGSTKRRKELRVGWNSKHSFNVCVTSYTLASRDAHIFKRKAWYYMILDEAHMIKNFKSQRWNILLMFRSFRRLLLTGTPLQNNLTELWALLQFLMSGTNFANLKEFGDWFSNPLEKAIEQGTVMDEETQERVRKLHTVLRPYLLRRLKADVEKELPSKFDHLVICRLSKRQRFLYDEFMSRAQTRDALASGVYHKVANILMQLRKVCNHPDLFEVRPIVTSFAMPRSATADFEIKELLVRRRILQHQGDSLNLDFLGLVFTHHQGKSMMQARSTRTLDASACLPFVTELPGEPPPVDTRTIAGFKRHMTYQRQLATLHQWTQIAYTNRLRCAASPVYGSETISVIRRLYTPLVPLSEVEFRRSDHLDRSILLPALIKSYQQREEELNGFIDRFAFVTPAVVARDMPYIALAGVESQIVRAQKLFPDLDTILHRASVKLQIAFPDASLIQYDCGKLQELASLLRKREAGGHRVLIFTQMTKVLDILEIFLNFHGYRYLRLDGATKIEDRQYITERFNNDARVFAFIASSRSGGVGINLTGADTVVFYDSDFNPQMDRQCEDRAHRIGQIRDVHIYRFISEHTVEESMLRKANQKRSLDNIVIQQGEFDWRSLLIDDEAFGKALGEFEDKEDAHAARVAAREEAVKEVEDRADFAGETDDVPATDALQPDISMVAATEVEEAEEEGTIADYMLAFVNRDWDWFSTMR